ncbi:9505_t:CDS:1, partial [Funneliformis mosseae]
ATKKLKGANSIITNVDDEVNKYWISAEVEDVKPLDWWKTHSTEYLNLSKLAFLYLCIQASSVPCEQLFFNCWSCFM